MDRKTARERLAKTIRAQCGASKMSIARLARETDIPYATLWSRLNGEYDFQVGELIAVADALGANAGEWIAA